MMQFMIQFKFGPDNYKALVQRPENRTDIVRRGVESFGGRLHYVEAGGRLGAAYEVVSVGANAVDLLALDTQTTRRLVQR